MNSLNTLSETIKFQNIEYEEFYQQSHDSNISMIPLQSALHKSIRQSSLNESNANTVITRFHDVIKQEQYEDVEDIKNDIAEQVEDSAILSYILEKITDKTDADMITRHIKVICKKHTENNTSSKPMPTTTSASTSATSATPFEPTALVSIDENQNADNNDGDDDLSADILGLKTKLVTAAKKLYPKTYRTVTSKFWPVMRREIIEQQLSLDDIEEEMVSLRQSGLFNTILKSNPEFQDEIFIIFIKIFGDNSALVQEILRNEGNHYNIDKIIKFRQKICKIRKHQNHKELKRRKLELSDDEILAIHYFSDNKSICHKYGKIIDFESDSKWKKLYILLRSGISKLYRVFHHRNNYQIDIKYLYNANSFQSIQELINIKLPVNFTSNKQEAMSCGKSMILLLIQPKLGLMSTELIGADMTWLLDLNDKYYRYIILPGSLQHFSVMDQATIAQHKFPHHSMIKHYKSNPYKRLKREEIIPRRPPRDNNNQNRLRQTNIMSHYRHHQQSQQKQIENIKREIIRIFKLQFDEQFAMRLLKAFVKVITEEQFDEIDTIRDDIDDFQSSAILESIWNDIGHLLRNPDQDKHKIIKSLRDIVNGKGKLFAIKDFTFTVKQKDVTIATELVKRECFMIYTHPDASNPNANKSQIGRANIAEDKSLCIAKAVDIKNGYPITPWLLDSFSRARVNGHKQRYLESGQTCDEYKFDQDRYSTGYNPTTWWLHDSAFCKYIQYKNAKMALPMMTAVQALSKRALPQINFNSKLSQVIHDDLNEFVKYTFASWAISYRLTKRMKSADLTTLKNDKKNIHFNYAPLQFDFWIIPQCTKPGQMNPVFDLNELLSDTDDNNIRDKWTLDFLFGNIQNRYNEMGKGANHERAQHPLWDLQQYLNKAGYKKGEDYFVELAEKTLGKLHEQFHQLWRCANGDSNRYRRYIFIIDRRNPKNLMAKSMGYVPPTFNMDDKDWSDKIYLIRPRKPNQTTAKGQPIYDEIPKQYTSIPEVCLGLSKQYLFPNVEKKEPDPIGMLDALNGYKFALSYHLLEYNASKAYWYINQGSQKFELDDMRWLWSRFFCKRDGKEQKLTENNLITLKEYSKNKRLPNEKFNEFWKQCDAMKIIHEK